MASTQYVPIAPALFEETRNLPVESTLYNMPDFVDTVIEMRDKLFELQSRGGIFSEEPTCSKEILRVWKESNKRRYGFKNDFRKHELVALFSARNFAKVLEIREAAGKLFKTGKVSTYTFKSINTRQTEAEVHEKLSEILSGNVTVRELNNAGKKGAEDGLILQQLDDQVKQLQKELEQWRSKCADLQRRLQASDKKNSEILRDFRALEQTIDSVKDRGEKENKRLQKEIDRRDQEIRHLKSSLLYDVLQDDGLQDSGYSTIFDEDESSLNIICLEEKVPSRKDADDDSVRDPLQKQISDQSEKNKSANKKTFEVTTSSGYTLTMTDSCYGSATPLENQSDQQVLKEKKEKENVNKPEGFEAVTMKTSKEKAKRERKRTEKTVLLEASDDEQDEGYKTPPKKCKRGSPVSSTPVTKEKSQPLEVQRTENVENKFVAVGYTAAKPGHPTFHLGQILASERKDSYLSVTFLQKIKGGRGYKWPKKPVIEEVYPHQIFITSLTANTESDGEYVFDEDYLLNEYEICLLKLSEMERHSKIEALWQDTEAPYLKVGRVYWKDLKTLQLKMPQEDYSNIMQPLMPKAWKVGYLNDEIIDEYLKLLEKKARKLGGKVITANTKFYSIILEGKSWKKKVDLHKFEKLVFANQFSANHWSLGVVDLKNAKLSILDPLGGSAHSNDVHFEHLRRFLNQRGFNKDWVEKKISHPLQKDSVSCGVYVLKMAESILLQSAMEFTQNDIEEYRYIVAERLLEENNFLNS